MRREQLEGLVRVVEAEANAPGSFFHGAQHWRCVALVGVRLAKVTPGADALVAFLFGLFHDARRETEDEDVGHGARGGRFARELMARGLVGLTETQRARLLFACETHTEAGPTRDPVVGVCYDADRLNLWRVGIAPEQSYLSTRAGKAAGVAQSTRDLHWEPLTWAQVLDALLGAG